MTPFFKTTKNILNKLFLIFQFSLVLVYIIFEEIIWNFIAEPIYNFIETFGLIKKLDSYLRSANRYLILSLFLLLFTAVELVGIIAGGLVVSGNIITGIGLYLLKIPVAVFTFWIFSVTKTQLMTFKWFARSYEAIQRFLQYIKNTQVYRTTMQMLANTKEYMMAIIQDIKMKFFNGKSNLIIRLKRIYFFIKRRINN